MSAEAQGAALAFEELLKADTLSLGRMASRMREAAEIGRRTWEVDAESYVEDLPALEAIEWLDLRRGVRWRVPGNVEWPASVEQAVAASLAVARERGEPSMATDGAGRYVIVVPAVAPGVVDGSIAAVFRADRTVKALAAHLLDADLTWVQNGAVVSRTGLGGSELKAAALVRARGAIPSGSQIELSAAPGSRRLRRSAAGIWTLGAFAAFGLLAGFQLRQIRKSGQQTRRLAESERRVQLALDNASQGLWDWNIETGHLHLDSTWQLIHGYEPGELPQQLATWDRTLHPDDRERVLGVLNRHLANDDHLYDVDYRARTKQEGWIWINARGRIESRDPGGRPVRMMGTVQNIQARKDAEALILASLRDKESLLAEVHHRVKNNLAVISSLLYLQGTKVKDDSAVLFEETQNRVRAMAKVHEALYRSGRFTSVDLGTYVDDLTRHLVSAYRGEHPSVYVRQAVEPAHLTVDQAIPCGLILNELVTNALKHAFVANAGGSLSVEGCRVGDRGYRLTVSDDGAGFPAEHLRGNESLGLRLVQSLARQIDAEFSLTPGNPGTRASLLLDLKGNEGTG